MRILDLVLIVLGMLVYLNLGYAFAHLNWKIYQSCLKYDKYPSWPCRILWPVSGGRPWHDLNPPISDSFKSREGYLKTMRYFWGLKIFWNLVVGIIAVIFYICIGTIGGAIFILGKIGNLVDYPIKKILNGNPS